MFCFAFLHAVDPKISKDRRDDPCVASRLGLLPMLSVRAVMCGQPFDGKLR